MTLDWHSMAQGTRRAPLTVTLTLVLLGGGCGVDIPGSVTGSGGRPPVEFDLAINELVSSNDGTSVDEVGETDDWIELVNASDAPLELSEYALVDGSGERVSLPERTVAPDETIVLWADDDPSQGPLHLPFKLSRDGERLALEHRDEPEAATLTVPALAPNEAFARFPDGRGDFAKCRYASPGRLNTRHCEPPAPPDLDPEFTFLPYDLADDYGAPRGPVALSEAALRPAAFVELVNLSDQDIALDDLRLTLAETAPGEEFPAASDGVEIPLPDATLAAGEYVSVPVRAALVRDTLVHQRFEGVLTLFDSADEVLDRWDFVRWPEDSVLARYPHRKSHPVFCRSNTPGARNDDCDPLPSRRVGNRVRHLYTPGDFAALAEGGTGLDMAPVKFVYDMQQGGAVHLLSSRSWALHYTFVREVIDGDPPLDRCIPEQATEFNAGWYAFSRTEYFQTEGRRYLLGTLVHHGGSDLYTVEYALGDWITGADMRRGFYAAMRHVMSPSRWALRPQDTNQSEKALTVDGRLPIVDMNAPFVGVNFQPLTTSVGYGTLRYVPTSELPQARLGPDVIVVTEDVPNDIALVGGLITEAFQTPLAHVNVLSRSRDTPNMALLDARADDRIEPFLDTLVRLEVRADGFTVEAADPAEAEAFWESRRPSGEVRSPPLDLSHRAVVDLTQADLSFLPIVGVKAAQLAELRLVSGAVPSSCMTAASWHLPATPLAVPVVHFIEHFQASGAQALLESLRDDVAFRTDPVVRSEGLAAVRDRITGHPVSPSLVAELEAAIRERFRTRRVRFRSSSNAEDLAGFNGAGLYTSTSVELDNPERSLEDGLRLVWSSLFNARAYDERELARISHFDVAMGVLIHPAFLSETANGVAVSRNVLDPARSDIYYVNAQIGEASVTNPAPGVATEQLIYRWPPRSPPITYQSHSSLVAPGTVVLDGDDVTAVACALWSIDSHFQPLLDPDGANPYFAMESEFKFLRSSRELIIKQARPHDFGRYESVGDCREF